MTSNAEAGMLRLILASLAQQQHEKRDGSLTEA